MQRKSRYNFSIGKTFRLFFAQKRENRIQCLMFWDRCCNQGEASELP